MAISDRPTEAQQRGRKVYLDAGSSKRSSKEQLRRSQRDANDSVRQLNRIFTENVKNGHESVVLRNSEGMLVSYERNRGLTQRLNEVYRGAGLLLPMEGGGFAASSDISQTPPRDTPRPLGY